MENKYLIIYFALLVIIWSGCAHVPSYVPEKQDLITSVYGSNIELYRKNAEAVIGELIAIDSSSVIILEDNEYEDYQDRMSPKKLRIIDHKQTDGFILRYSQPVHYAWTIPVFSLATFLHGWWSIFTFPINLAVTISVTTGGHTSFRYNEHDISLSQLKIFARFPQGIPPNIKLTDIR